MAYLFHLLGGKSLKKQKDIRRVEENEQGENTLCAISCGGEDFLNDWDKVVGECNRGGNVDALG